jgi:tryptophan-rich sensory protein
MEISIKLNYIIFSLITFVVSVLGRFYTSTGMQWYYTLNLPSYTPPGWFIGSVWTVIFALTTVAVIMVWNRFQRDTQFWAIMGLFALNAFFNVLWTYLFFYKHMITFSILDAGALFVTVLLLIIMIGQRSLFIASLLAPYLGWVAFATWLNLMIWFMN